MIGGTRNTLLAASLLVAAPAIAAQPDGGHVRLGAQRRRTVVSAAGSVRIDRRARRIVPVARMIAQQEASMHRMVADIEFADDDGDA